MKAPFTPVAPALAVLAHPHSHAPPLLTQPHAQPPPHSPSHTQSPSSHLSHAALTPAALLHTQPLHTLTSLTRAAPYTHPHTPTPPTHTHTSPLHTRSSFPQLFRGERAVSVGPPVSPAAQTSGSFSPLCQRKAACPASAAGGAALQEAQHCGLVPPGGHPTPPTIWGMCTSPHPTSTPRTNKKRNPNYAHASLPRCVPSLPGPPALSPTPGPRGCPVSLSSSNSRSPRPAASPPTALGAFRRFPAPQGLVCPQSSPSLFLAFQFVYVSVPVSPQLCVPQTLSCFPISFPFSPPCCPYLPSPALIFPYPSVSLFPFPLQSPSSPLPGRIPPQTPHFLHLSVEFSHPRAFPHPTPPQPPPYSGNAPAELPASVSFPTPSSVRGPSPRADVQREGEGVGGPRASRLGLAGLGPQTCYARGEASAGPLATGEGWSGPAGTRGSARVGAPPRAGLPSALGLALDLSSAAQLGAWISSCACWFQIFSALPGPPSTLIRVPTSPSGDSGRPTRRSGLGTG